MKENNDRSTDRRWRWLACLLAAGLGTGGCAGSEPVPFFDGRWATAGDLPERYDAREHGKVSPVQDQGDLGTCWAFASLGALQSTLLPEEELDFSEDHMSHNPSFRLSQEEGGEYTMAMAYLLSWQGPVPESEDPYGDGISPEGLEPVKHVQEIRLLPAKDRNRIKQAVYETGGVQSSLYTTQENSDTGTYYYPDERIPNHDVVIVGWEDDFPKESFPVEPPEDGAFLCANSWGTRFGTEGYFYVSYFDANIASNNILYTGIEETDHYDHIYQSDLCGWIGQLGFGENTAWAVNVYTASGDERLGAVGFYATGPDTEVEVYVVRHVPAVPSDNVWWRRELVAEGTMSEAGFYTIPVADNILLEADERYGVMLRIHTPKAVHPVAIEYDAGDGKSRIDLEDGEGYISPSGERWQSVEKEQAGNICLKAYTIDV